MDSNIGISIPQAAHVLGVSAKTVRRRLRAGVIAAVQADGPGGFKWRVTDPLLVAAGLGQRPVNTELNNARAVKTIDLEGAACAKCGATERLERHHPDHENAPNHVVILCRPCHTATDSARRRRIRRAAALAGGPSAARENEAQAAPASMAAAVVALAEKLAASEVRAARLAWELGRLQAELRGLYRAKLNGTAE
jgi:hypothetical protein